MVTFWIRKSNKYKKDIPISPTETEGYRLKRKTTKKPKGRASTQTPEEVFETWSQLKLRTFPCYTFTTEATESHCFTKIWNCWVLVSAKMYNLVQLPILHIITDWANPYHWVSRTRANVLRMSQKVSQLEDPNSSIRQRIIIVVVPNKKRTLITRVSSCCNLFSKLGIKTEYCWSELHHGSMLIFSARNQSHWYGIGSNRKLYIW